MGRTEVSLQPLPISEHLILDAIFSSSPHNAGLRAGDRPLITSLHRGLIMSRNAFLQLAACFAISFATLTGCSESGTPSTDQTSATQSADVDSAEAPVGRLDNSVVPNRYSIELRIDPSQERFSGSVTIDISLNEPRDSIWLHGKNLDISEVYLTDSHSDRVEASYE